MLNINVNLPVDWVHSYFNGGDLLVQVDRVWCLYNSENKVVRNFQDFDYPSCLIIFKYAKSLISISGFKQVNLNGHNVVIIFLIKFTFGFGRWLRLYGFSVPLYYRTLSWSYGIIWCFLLPVDMVKYVIYILLIIVSILLWHSRVKGSLHLQLVELLLCYWCLVFDSSQLYSL